MIHLFNTKYTFGEDDQLLLNSVELKFFAFGSDILKYSVMI